MRRDIKSVSGTAEERANDFQKLWSDPSIAAIIPPWGGEFLINILPHLDFTKLKNHPKWLLGYSDISTLLFAITTVTDVATAHGLNLMDSLIDQSDPLSSLTYPILQMTEGDTIVQKSSERYQTEFEDFAKNPRAVFNLKHNTLWKTLNGEDEIVFSGRIIGGCLDTLRNLVGTPFGDLPNFASRFNDSKIILYLENANSSATEVCRALWNMKLAGWFDSVSGVLLGRSAAPDSKQEFVFTYVDALKDVFGDLKFPVIYDADIGHQPPQFTILNGSLAEVSFRKGAGTLTQVFK